MFLRGVARGVKGGVARVVRRDDFRPGLTMLGPNHFLGKRGAIF